MSNSLPLTCIYIYIYTHICYMHTLSHGKCLIYMLTRFSHGQLLVTSWTVAHQAPLSMIFFWQEYWSGLPCPPPGDLPNPGIKLASLASHVLQQILYCRATRGKLQSIPYCFQFSSAEHSSLLLFPLPRMEFLCFVTALVSFHSSLWPFILFNVLL